jgi:hypothetical protein
MTTNQFKKGDRVTLARLYNVDAQHGLKAGMVGTIVPDALDFLGWSSEDHRIVTVKWDGYDGGTRTPFDEERAHRAMHISQLEPLAKANAA